LLLGSPEKVTTKMPEVLRDAVTLNPYVLWTIVTQAIYPDVTESDAEKALRLADDVRKEIRARLPRMPSNKKTGAFTMEPW